jgi:hypothetical protein
MWRFQLYVGLAQTEAAVFLLFSSCACIDEYERRKTRSSKNEDSPRKDALPGNPDGAGRQARPSI